MLQNGTHLSEKETGVQRLDRYIADFRRKALKEMENRITGHVCLTVNFNDGSILRRQIVAEEVGK